MVHTIKHKYNQISIILNHAKKTITLNGNFASPVNISSSLNVTGDNVSFNTPMGTDNISINDKSLTEILNEIKPSIDITPSLDYTALEVYPTKNNILVEDSYLGEIDVEIPASMTQLLGLRSGVYPGEDLSSVDIYIDWGDGTGKMHVSECLEANFVNNNNEPVSNPYLYKWTDKAHDEVGYIVSHTYADEFDKTPCIIKIYGKDYWGFSPYYYKKYAVPEYNIISRILSNDLPFASQIIDFSYLCYGSYKLVKVDIPSGFVDSFRRFVNSASTFRDCKNLKTVYGLGRQLQNVNGHEMMFYKCENLVDTDFELSSSFLRSASGYHGTYSCFGHCYKLATSLEKLIPAVGFSNRKLYMNTVFQNCSSLKFNPNKMSEIADLLWNDTSKVWMGTSRCFEGCSDELRSYVPVSWGGTKS